MSNGVRSDTWDPTSEHATQIYTNVRRALGVDRIDTIGVICDASSTFSDFSAATALDFFRAGNTSQFIIRQVFLVALESLSRFIC